MPDPPFRFFEGLVPRLVGHNIDRHIHVNYMSGLACRSCPVCKFNKQWPHISRCSPPLVLCLPSSLLRREDPKMRNAITTAPISPTGQETVHDLEHTRGRSSLL